MARDLVRSGFLGNVGEARAHKTEEEEDVACESISWQFFHLLKNPKRNAAVSIRLHANFIEIIAGLAVVNPRPPVSNDDRKVKVAGLD